MTTEAFVSHLATVEGDLGASPCAEGESSQLERIAGRSTVHCWRLAALEGGAELVAAQFAHVDTTALAAAALVQDSVVLLRGLPGRYSAPGASIWRVDDGSVLDPSAIRPLLAAKLPDGWTAAFAWAGAEGESLQLVVADSTVEARSVLEAYRYWSPP